MQLGAVQAIAPPLRMHAGGCGRGSSARDPLVLNPDEMYQPWCGTAAAARGGHQTQAEEQRSNFGLKRVREIGVARRRSASEPAPVLDLIDTTPDGEDPTSRRKGLEICRKMDSTND